MLFFCNVQDFTSVAMFGVTLLLVILPMRTTFSRELLIVYDSNKMGRIYTDSLSFQEDLGVYSLPTTTPQILQP